MCFPTSPSSVPPTHVKFPPTSFWFPRRRFEFSGTLIRFPRTIWLFPTPRFCLIPFRPCSFPRKVFRRFYFFDHLDFVWHSGAFRNVYTWRVGGKEYILPSKISARNKPLRSLQLFLNRSSISLNRIALTVKPDEYHIPLPEKNDNISFDKLNISN